MPECLVMNRLCLGIHGQCCSNIQSTYHCFINFVRYCVMKITFSEEFNPSLTIKCLPISVSKSNAKRFASNLFHCVSLCYNSCCCSICLFCIVLRLISHEGVSSLHAPFQSSKPYKCHSYPSF